MVIEGVCCLQMLLLMLTLINLQKLIDVMYGFCNRWRQSANASEVQWYLEYRGLDVGKTKLLNVSSYTCSG